MIYYDLIQHEYKYHQHPFASEYELLGHIFNTDDQTNYAWENGTIITNTDVIEQQRFHVPERPDGNQEHRSGLLQLRYEEYRSRQQGRILSDIVIRQNTLLQHAPDDTTPLYGIALAYYLTVKQQEPLWLFVNRYAGYYQKKLLKIFKKNQLFHTSEGYKHALADIIESYTFQHLQHYWVCNQKEIVKIARSKNLKLGTHYNTIEPKHDMREPDWFIPQTIPTELTAVEQLRQGHLNEEKYKDQFKEEIAAKIALHMTGNLLN